MGIKSITYTSHARLDLNADDLRSIQQKSRRWNAINGVTGLLIFNGTHFLQIIEGPVAAIDELLGCLRRDHRHSSLEIRDARVIGNRSFPDWAMELVQVETTYFQAKEAISECIPSSVSTEVRDRIHHFTEAISGTVRL